MDPAGCHHEPEVKDMGHGGNVIDELVTDHREVEEIFGKIEQLPPGHKDRKVYADQATIELVRHSVAEEAYLYPAVREHVRGGDALADKELEDHAKAEQLMKDIERCDAGDPEFDRLVGSLMTEIREHIADEEQNLFPLLRASCSTDALDQLGDKIRQAKKTAPTRPHPAAPDKPPANKLLAPGAGMVDRLRDALSGRGKLG
ncbi:hemerythrin [Streptomyces griseoloalbus]|nr:hemerythrin [Streptomyces griseoloalbus]